MTIYHTPKNEQPMDEIYVVLSQDDTGEGIISAMTDVGATPLVFGHARMIPLMKNVAKKMAKDTGKKVVIGKFKRIETIEEL